MPQWLHTFGWSVVVMVAMPQWLHTFGWSVAALSQWLHTFASVWLFCCRVLYHHNETPSSVKQAFLRLMARIS